MKQQTQINKNEWKEIALGDKNYFKIIGSGIDKFTGEKEYLSTESIKGTKIEKIECKIKYNDKPSRANMQPVINSVWLAKMQATLKVYAFTKDNEKEINQYILSTGFAGIKVLNKNISPEYIRIYLTTDKFNLEKDKLCTGSTQRGINNSFIIKMKIPLPFLPDGTPDLKEQGRIVKILEENERQLKRADRAEKLLDEYLRSVFNEMFYNKGFEEVELNKICGFIDYRGKTPKKTSYGIPLITAKNVREGWLSKYPEEFIAQEDYKSWMRRGFPKKGDVLFTTEAPLGNVAVLGNFDKIALAQRIITLQPKERVNYYYLMFMLLSNFMKFRIKANSTGSTVSGIRSKEFKKIKIPLPPLPLQQKFSRIVEQVEKMKENINKTKQNAEELFNALMQKAFRGEL